jgi:hypothetical protein
MFASKKIAFGFGAAVLVIAAASVLTFGHGPAEPIYLSCTGVSSASNSNLISIVISNPSPANIVYLVQNPEFKSNGFWAGIPFPSGLKMDILPSGQSDSQVVMAPSGVGAARIPVLWGFTSSAMPSKRSMWRQLGDDAIAFLRMHDFRGSGALYTNYVEGIQLK